MQITRSTAKESVSFSLHDTGNPSPSTVPLSLPSLPQITRWTSHSRSFSCRSDSTPTCSKSSALRVIPEPNSQLDNNLSPSTAQQLPQVIGSLALPSLRVLWIEERLWDEGVRSFFRSDAIVNLVNLERLSLVSKRRNGEVRGRHVLEGGRVRVVSADVS